MTSTWVRSDSRQVIRLDVQGILDHRDTVMRTVSSACRLCMGGVDDATARDLRSRALSAVGEAFNNIVVHGYRDRAPGRVQLEILIGAAELTVRLSDDGVSFDPRKGRVPDLGALPESGLGTFIIRSFVDRVEYAPGPPNVLTLEMVVRHAPGA
jgi:serine/threonine-protein kinase RsbW